MVRTILDKLFGRTPPVAPPEPDSIRKLRRQEQEARSAALRRDLLVLEVNNTIARLKQ